MFKTLLLVLALSTSAHAAGEGFSRGNEFVATPIQGQVRVVCEGFNGNGNATFNCRDVALAPGSYDYFVGPQAGRASALDRVELIATLEDGTTRTKNSGYDALQGKSRDAFNLWISTLFQKPLLSYGVHNIRYKIYLSDNRVEHILDGNFSATVRRGAARTCPTVEYTSSDINDCNSQYSVCQRYFEEFKNCQ